MVPDGQPISVTSSGTRISEHGRQEQCGQLRSKAPFCEMDLVLITVLLSRVLKRGGWVQMIELYFNVQSDNGSITDEHALRRWSTQYMRALEDKKDLRVGSRLRNMLTSAGLTEVDTKMIPLPLSAWSNG